MFTELTKKFLPCQSEQHFLKRKGKKIFRFLFHFSFATDGWDSSVKIL